MIKRLPWLALIAFVLACDQSIITPQARLRGPLDSVIAGTSSQYMYVAGGVYDALYIMDLTTGANIATVGSFVRAPNKFFPLEVPVGKSPTSLSSAFDGQFVLALCAADHSVYLVDADQQLTVRDADGEKEKLDVGSGAAMIIAAPNVIAENTRRFYVSNVLEKSVHIVDVVKNADGTASLEDGGTIQNTGSMKRMVISSDGVFIFGTDLSSHFVHRVDTTTQTTIDIDVKGYATDVALGANGAILFVARADTLSVDMYNPFTGAAQPADAEVTPLLSDSIPFDGFYIGDIPARLEAIDFPEGGVDTTCIADATAKGPTVNSVVLVASDSGNVYFIDAAQGRVMDVLFCQPPAVAPPNTDTTLFADGGPFEPCSTLLNRLYCDQSSGVVLAKGQVPLTEFTLFWEGVIPGLERSTGGGTFLEDGAVLVDQGIDLSLFDVRVGDLVNVLTTPLPSIECQGLYAQESQRQFEVTSVDPVEGHSRGLRLQPAVRADCFPPIASALSYLVRARESYTVFRQTNPTANGVIEPLPRLKPGDTFGGDGAPVRFTLRTDRQRLPGEINFQVRATYQRMTGGRVLIQDNITNPLVPAGRIPTSITIAKEVGSPPPGSRFFVAFFTFAATDTIVYFDPRSSANTENGTSAFVVR